MLRLKVRVNRSCDFDFVLSDRSRDVHHKPKRFFSTIFTSTVNDIGFNSMAQCFLMER